MGAHTQSGVEEGVAYGTYIEQDMVFCIVPKYIIERAGRQHQAGGQAGRSVEESDVGRKRFKRERSQKKTPHRWSSKEPHYSICGRFIS